MIDRDSGNTLGPQATAVLAEDYLVSASEAFCNLFRLAPTSHAFQTAGLWRTELFLNQCPDFEDLFADAETTIALDLPPLHEGEQLERLSVQFRSAAAIPKRLVLVTAWSSCDVQFSWESRCKIIQDIAGVGYWEYEPEHDKLSWDSKTYRMLGQSPETFSPSIESLLTLLTPESRQQNQNKMREWIESGRTCGQTELSLLHAHRTRHLAVECRIAREGDSVTRVFGIAADCTASKQAKQRLQQKLSRAKQAQQIAHFGHWDWDVSSGNVVWSDEVYRIFGLDKESFSPHIDSIMERTHPEDNSMGQRLIQRAIDERKPGWYEMRIFRPSGEMRWFESNFEPIFNEDGELNSILGTAHDITERKQAEILVRQREDQLRVILDSIGDGVIATDIDGRVNHMNPVAEELTGWSVDDATGMPLEAVFQAYSSQSGAELENIAARVFQEGRTISLAKHTMLRMRHGRDRQIADSCAPIRDGDGKIIGAVLVFQDITEEYALQEQLRQSQKMEAIGLLAGGIAHDFNNMLGGIIGAAELLESYLGDHPQAAKFQELILHTAERAGELTKSLLAFSRQNPVDSTVVDLHEIIEAALTLLRSTVDRRIEIELGLEAGEPRVTGDPSYLQSAILNLSINAAHAMPNGGRLSIFTENAMLDPLYCEASAFDLTPGQYLQIEIRDTGHGIAPCDLPNIFDPFFTTKKVGEGTGLGLSAVYGTVQRHCGAISVYSELEKGTCFQILLPTSTQETTPDLSAQSTLIRGEGRILVVDDEAVMRVTAKAILEGLGYEVLVAENGKEAVDLFRQQPDDIDLVVLDMIMPVMNGRDCFLQLKKIRSDVRVILASGFAHDNDVDEIQTLGLLAFIHKPFRSAVLSQVVHQCLHLDKNDPAQKRMLPSSPAGRRSGPA